MELLEAIILSILAASTPLLIAATGELVTERSGVLNLGVEGMMIVGAACGFGGALYTGSITIGAICGIIARHIAFADLCADDARPRRQPGRHRTCAHDPRHRIIRADRRRLRRRKDHARTPSTYSRSDRSAVPGPDPVRRRCAGLFFAAPDRRRLVVPLQDAGGACICARAATTIFRRTHSAIRCCGYGCWP